PRGLRQERRRRLRACPLSRLLLRRRLRRDDDPDADDAALRQPCSRRGPEPRRKRRHRRRARRLLCALPELRGVRARRNHPRARLGHVLPRLLVPLPAVRSQLRALLLDRERRRRRLLRPRRRLHLRPHRRAHPRQRGKGPAAGLRRRPRRAGVTRSMATDDLGGSMRGSPCEANVEGVLPQSAEVRTVTRPRRVASSGHSRYVTLLAATAPGLRNRRTIDSVFLLLAAVVLGLSAAIASATPRQEHHVDDRLSWVVGWAGGFWDAAFVCALLLALSVVVDVLLRRRWDLARDLLVAGLVMVGAAAVLGGAVADNWLPIKVHILAQW